MSADRPGRFAAKLLPWPVHAVVAALCAAVGVCFLSFGADGSGEVVLVIVVAVLAAGCVVYGVISLRARR